MKLIPLTQNQYAKVDDEDYEWLMQWKWYARYNRYTQSFYAIRNEGKRPNRKSIMMHCDIMKTPKGMQCDHVHHDTLDNRKEELRNVTKSQNQMNRKSAPKSNHIGILGVVKCFSGFRAHISNNGKNLWFPVRRTIEEALIDRKNAEIKFYGEFSNQEKVS